METKANDNHVNNLKSKLQLDKVHIVSKQNTRGDLALFWKFEINLHIIDTSPSHIDVVINPGVDDTWQFIGFYENPMTANREHSWEMLKHLNLKLELPWLCVGDFNETVKNKEKMGVALWQERHMVEFRDALNFGIWVSWVHLLPSATISTTEQSLGSDWIRELLQIPGFKCSHQPMSTISQVHFRIITHCGFVLMMKIFNFTGK